jgi:hypothetical protein
MPTNEPVRPNSDDPTAPSLDRMRSSLPRGVGMPAARALVAAGFSNLDSLDGSSAAYLLSLHGMGPKALGVLREALASRGKALRA